MSRTATVVWMILGAVIILLVIVGLIYGPGLYKEGKSMVAPVMELARAEKDIDILNQEFPFSPPTDGIVPQDRFALFLEIRRELLPVYESWDHSARIVEKEKGDGWEAAKEIIGATSDVFSEQIGILRRNGMSPSEFRWLEEQIYDTWLPSAKKTAAGRTPEVSRQLLESTRRDLQYIDDLADRHGGSTALREMKARLETRAVDLETPERPDVPGIPAENGNLFWSRMDDIAALDLDRFEMHVRLRETGTDNINIKLNKDSTRSITIDK